MRSRVLNNEQVASVRRMLGNGISADLIAANMGVSSATVHDIRRGRTHSHHGGADPFPEQIRAALERERRKGVEFPVAWANALELHPAPYDWRSKNAGEGVSPLEFARHVFARAYAGIPLTGSVTAPEPSVSTTPRPKVKPTRRHCRWGAGCDTAVNGTARFCARHRDILATIALRPYEASREYETLAVA